MTEEEKLLLYSSIGLRIRQLRMQAGISQGSFAELLSLSRASIVNIEKGRQHPSLHLLWDIARVLKIEIDALIATNYITTKTTLQKLDTDWKTKIDTSIPDNAEARKKITELIRRTATSRYHQTESK